PGEILAELSVPELVQEHKQKQALVAQADAEVDQAQANLDAAKAHVATVKSQIQEAVAAKGKADANLELWSREYERLRDLVTDGVVGEQSRDVAFKHKQSTQAEVKEMEAKVATAQALFGQSEAQRDKV